MLDLKVTGIDELNAYLRTVERKLSNTQQLFRRMSQVLRREFLQSMASGKDPDGIPLAPVAVWTRIAGSGAGATRNHAGAIPLNNTGAMRASVGPVSVTRTSLEFGFHGKQLKKAAAMIEGRAGRMILRDKSIKGSYSGPRRARKDNHGYIRVKDPDAGWITKQATGGTIAIHPRARNFFYLSSKQGAELARITDEWIGEALAN